MKTQVATGGAFGFAVESLEPIPGLDGGDAGPDAPTVTVSVAEAGSVTPALHGGEELMSRRTPDGGLVATVSRDDEGNYRIYGAGFGVYDVSADASEIACRPPSLTEPWIWQRFLMSQALPLAATLRGVEPFHASAVLVDDRVVAISGTSGAGKSSLSLSLAARGLPFYTDDVLAVAREGDSVRCKAGPGAANVRDPGLRRLVSLGEFPFEGVLGETPDGVRALVKPAGRDRPLGAIYFLDHRPEHREVVFERTSDPRLLLGHTFNALVRTPERLVGQLALCSLIAQKASLFRLRVPSETTVGDLATRVEQHARELLA